MIKRIFIVFLITFLGFTSCVERGKPVKNNVNEQAKLSTKKKMAHYICPNGHAGSDKQGKCSECNATLQHNQAYHGLNIPKDAIKDPFNGNSNTQTNTSPAQNAYGDYHYTCPNGHSGGSGTAENCTTCGTKLTHNQLYHK